MPAPSHGRYPYPPSPSAGPTTGRRANGWRSISALIWNGLPSAKGSAPSLPRAGRRPTCSITLGATTATASACFRLADLFAELKLPVSLLVNAQMTEHAPQAIRAFPGAEIVGHGRTNSERQGTLFESEERTLIAETTAMLTTFSGQAPRGWLGPWISQSPLTPDLLQEAGLQLSARLVPRRPADLDDNAQGPHPLGALPAGDQ